ncbi:MAG: thioesterase family protein [Bacteroidales bacterium]
MNTTMFINLKEGLTYTSKKMITDTDTASAYGSGLVEVFATPAMIGLMENAAMNTVLPHLADGFGTVGTEISVVHSKATPKGMWVESTATLTKIDGKTLYFNLIAFDEQGEIGRGTHTRYIIDTERFTHKVYGK